MRQRRSRMRLGIPSSALEDIDKRHNILSIHQNCRIIPRYAALYITSDDESGAVLAPSPLSCAANQGARGKRSASPLLSLAYTLRQSGFSSFLTGALAEPFVRLISSRHSCSLGYHLPESAMMRPFDAFKGQRYRPCCPSNAGKSSE